MCWFAGSARRSGLRDRCIISVASSPAGEVLSDRQAYIALNLLPVPPPVLRALLDRCASAAEALEAACGGALQAVSPASLVGLDERGGHPSPVPACGLERRGVHGGKPRGDGIDDRTKEREYRQPAAFGTDSDDPDAPAAPSGPAAASERFPAGRNGTQTLDHLRALLRLGARSLLDRAARESEKARAKGFSIVTLEDEGYPSLLREITDPPPVIYIGGCLEPDDEVRLALVGSRRATRYGLDIAETLGRRLARRGITVVSGLARGIDAAGHRGALSAGARTIAVLGSGLERIYPPENRGLARRIMEDGAVISEFPLDLPPLPRFFPRRNRVISGLCAGVVVVEAAFASGALVTARLALEQSRELYAVPGSILSPASAGTDDLLASASAHLVTCAEAILDELPAAFRVRLGLPPSPPIEGSGWRRRPGCVPFIDEDAEIEAADTDLATGGVVPAAAFGPDTDLVARHLTREDSVSVDELATLCRLPVPRLLAALSVLELKGIAVALPGNRVARSR